MRLFNNVARRTDPDFANNFIGDEVAASWYVDNIAAVSAVPEPSGLWLLVPALAGILTVWRRPDMTGQLPGK